MLHKIAIPIIGCLALAMILVTFRPGQAQQETAAYFPEAGHYVDEPFLSSFEAHGGLQVLGLPITEPLEENGQLVQYFENARLQCVEQNQGPCEATLSALGESLGKQTPRVSPVPHSMIRDGLCRYFTETGHNICFSFLAFYLENGGADILGPPITEVIVEPGVIAQYFRHARLEWHTDAPASVAMQFGDLGREYFDARGLDPSLLAPVESPGVSATLSLEISVGGRVAVLNTEGAGLRMRSGPGLSHSTVETAQDGEVLQVVGGPETADGFTWWQLDHDGTLGWCASEWLEPVATHGGPQE